MKRREFIRIIAGTAVMTALAPKYSFATQKTYDTSGVLVEASSFDEFGGWSLDTQFYQQIGGCYLNAHGLGKPVNNATTKIELPNKGQWNVFVRCKDWCPGTWQSPGQFNIKINDERLPNMMGIEKNWGWCNAGGFNANERETHLSLEDLTGFNGRCDAVYFSQSANPKLPSDVSEVIAWKDQLSGRNQLQIDKKSFDLVVVGGGIAGCAAALAADSKGLRVALIQDRPVFGGNASEEVRVHTLGVFGKNEKLLKKIDTKHYDNGSDESKLDQLKRENNLANSGITLYNNYLAIGLEKQDNKIASIDTKHTSTGLITRFSAPVFIDCTGDGWLGYWSGAQYRYGREASTEFKESWNKYGDLWSPSKPDDRVMGTSLLWNSDKENSPNIFPTVPWAMPIAGKEEHANGDWDWEFTSNSLNQITDAEEIRDHMLRAIYGSFYNFKRHRKNSLISLKWVGLVGGRRESRRIIGDYIYSMKDATEHREFFDTVVEEERELDSHYQIKETGNSADFRSKALFYKLHKLYYLPFRTLYSKDINNLMMAGRCFSCTHIGLSGPRVMNTCGQMGIAVGYAAALCKKHKSLPRTIGEKHIKELRSLIGYNS